MITTPRRITAASILSLLAHGHEPRAQTPDLVVPAALTTTNGAGCMPLPGAGYDARLQILISEAQLAPATLGRRITQLRLRRQDERMRPVSGGGIHLQVRIGTTSRAPLEASETFAANFSDPATTVLAHDGPLTLAASPAPGPTTADWNDAGDRVAIPLTTPFVYTGGTLCIELTGRAVAGNEPGAWNLDGFYEPLAGSVTREGQPCGSTGQTFINEAELVGGHTLRIAGTGPSATNAAVLLGAPMPGFDLSLLGLSAPGCELAVLPIVSLATHYGPAHPGELTSNGDVQLPLPSAPSALAAQISAQFVTLGPQLEVSDTAHCTLAGQLPAAGVASVYGRIDAGNVPLEGRVWSTRAPVIAFDWGN